MGIEYLHNFENSVAYIRLEKKKENGKVYSKREAC